MAIRKKKLTLSVSSLPVELAKQDKLNISEFLEQALSKRYSIPIKAKKEDGR